MCFASLCFNSFENLMLFLDRRQHKMQYKKSFILRFLFCVYFIEQHLIEPLFHFATGRYSTYALDAGTLRSGLFRILIFNYDVHNYFTICVGMPRYDAGHIFVSFFFFSNSIDWNNMHLILPLLIPLAFRHDLSHGNS